MVSRPEPGASPDLTSIVRPNGLGDGAEPAMIVFDLFGTLVPQFPRVEHEQVLAECSNIVGLDPAVCQHAWRDLYVARVTGTVSGIAGHLAHVAGQQRVVLDDDRLAEACAVYRRFVRQMLIPTDDALAALKSLRAARVRIGLLSNAHADVAEAFQESELAPHFAAAVFSSRVGCKKPDPAAFAAVTQAMGLARGKGVIFVGDGSDDEMAGAAAAGMRPVLLRCDLRNAYDDVRPQLDGWTGEEIHGLTELGKLIG